MRYGCPSKARASHVCCLRMSLLLLGMSHEVPRTSKAMSKWRTPPLTVVVKVDTEKGPLTHGASLSSPAVAEGIAESIQTLVAATGSRRSRFRCAKNCGLEPCTSKLAIFQRQRQSLNASKYHKTVAAITKHHVGSELKRHFLGWSSTAGLGTRTS